MTNSHKHELLALVEALCEETASPADISRLEHLVLHSTSARKLYVEAMSLHGLLYWDAAGRGAAESVPEISLPVASNALQSPLVNGASAANRASSVHETRSGLPSQKKPIRKNRSPRRRIMQTLTGLASVVLIGVCLSWFRPEPNHLAQNSVPPDQHPTGTNQHSLVPQKSHPDVRTVPDVHLPSLPHDPETVQQSPGAMSGVLPGETTAPVNESPIAELTSDSAIVARINERLLTRWNDENVAPAARANDAEWVRRTYLDLAGRIPTSTETETFFRQSNPQKRQELVDALLASRGFSRHLATVWTNLLVGRSREMNIDRESLLAWLEQEFSQGRSWRETVTELVAARGTATQSGPANFLLAHLNNEAVPATAITSRIFLCEQLQCTQCHQHPTVKSWGQERFWEMNAFFQQARIQNTSVMDEKSGKQRRVPELVDAEDFGPTYYETLRGVMQVAFPKFAGAEINPQLSDEQTPLREQLAELLFTEKHPQSARAFVNRTWAQLMGYGFTTPVDDMGPHTPVSHPELLEDLTGAFVASGYDVHRLVRWICLSDAYQLTSQPAQAESLDAPEAGELPLFSRMYLKPLSAEQLFDSLRVASGISPQQLADDTSQQRREEWLQQFYSAVDTEENGEASTFDGTLQQALMMMNGELIQEATNLRQGRVMVEITSRNGLAETERIKQLCLAALSRYPTSEELSKIRELLRRTVRQRVIEENVPPQLALAEGLKDLYWAYLNSSEFAVNH